MNTALLILKRYWFFVGMALMFVAALSLRSRATDALPLAQILDVGVFLCFLSTGLTLPTSTIGREISRIDRLAVALASCYVLAPLLALVLAQYVFQGDEEFIVGACLLGVLPVTFASGVVLTRMAEGNVALSLLINVGANVLAIVTVPFSLRLLLGWTIGLETAATLPVGRMIIQLSLIVLLPTVIGQVLRPWLGNWAVSQRRRLSLFSQVVVLLVIFNGAAKSADRIAEMGSGIMTMLLFVTILHVLLLAANNALARLLRLDLASRAAFVLQTSQKTLTGGYVVWSGFFSEAYPAALIAAIAYHLVQLLIDSFIAELYRNQAMELTPAAPSAPPKP